jgi:hypothetical protein
MKPPSKNGGCPGKEKKIRAGRKQCAYYKMKRHLKNDQSYEQNLRINGLLRIL